MEFYRPQNENCFYKKAHCPKKSILKRIDTGTFDVSCGMFSNVISFVLKDSKFDRAFCISWPEN